METLNTSVTNDGGMANYSFPVHTFLSHHVTRDSHRYAELNLTAIPCRLQPWYAYWVGGYSTTVLCSFAIFGNLICMLVLSRPVMKSSVNFILLALSCSDLVQVVSTLLMRGVVRICEYHCVGLYYTHWIQPILTPYLFPIGTTAQVTSVYLTVLVSIERYVAVCKPFRARVWFSWRKSSIFCLGVILFSILYNFPTWFELDTKRKYSLDRVFQGLAVRRTSLYRDPTYVFYYVNLGSFVVIRLIPFALLVVLNSFIYNAIRQMNRARKHMTQSQSHEVSIARMLFCVVIIFLVCNLLTIISHMLEAFNAPHPPELQSASNFLVLLNAALNFLIYCFLSRNFRKVLLRLLGATWDPTDFRGRTRNTNTSTISSFVQQWRERRMQHRRREQHASSTVPTTVQGD